MRRMHRTTWAQHTRVHPFAWRQEPRHQQTRTGAVSWSLGRLFARWADSDVCTLPISAGTCIANLVRLAYNALGHLMNEKTGSFCEAHTASDSSSQRAASNAACPDKDRPTQWGRTSAQARSEVLVGAFRWKNPGEHILTSLVSTARGSQVRCTLDHCVRGGGAESATADTRIHTNQHSGSHAHIV